MASCDAELKNSRAGEGDHRPTSALARSMSSSLNWKSVAFSNSADVAVIATALPERRSGRPLARALNVKSTLFLADIASRLAHERAERVQVPAHPVQGKLPVTG